MEDGTKQFDAYYHPSPREDGGINTRVMVDKVFETPQQQQRQNLIEKFELGDGHFSVDQLKLLRTEFRVWLCRLGEGDTEYDNNDRIIQQRMPSSAIEKTYDIESQYMAALTPELVLRCLTEPDEDFTRALAMLESAAHANYAMIVQHAPKLTETDQTAEKWDQDRIQHSYWIESVNTLILDRVFFILIAIFFVVIAYGQIPDQVPTALEWVYFGFTFTASVFYIFVWVQKNKYSHDKNTVNSRRSLYLWTVVGGIIGMAVTIVRIGLYIGVSVQTYLRSRS